MDRREVLSVSGALAAAALAGCTGNAGSETPTGTGDDGTTQPTDTTTGDPTMTGQTDDGRLAKLATDNAAFGLDLYRYLANQGGNAFFSPYSVSVALAMTYAGARGETREEMTEALHFGLGEEVHPVFGDLRAALADRETVDNPDPSEDGEVDAFQLNTANAPWGREGYDFAGDYLSLLEEHYGAGLRRADFAGDPGGERRRINDWVAEQTEDKISDLLPAGSIDASTVLVLTNAIYFAAAWAHQFDPEDTEDATFTALDGTESTVPTMHQELRAEHASVAGAEAVEVPYVGKQVSMVLILPDEGRFRTFEKHLDADRLLDIFEELSDARGELALPRFEYETGIQLSDALSTLGMPGAFESGADFGGMVEEGTGPWIDEVYHDAHVSVDEEGTEAAAATAVVMTESAPPEWGELRFDRPFLFCIRDRPTDAVLFLGRVVDAGAAQGGE